MMNTAEAAGAAGTLDMKYVLTCVLLMALVTYIPRVLPVTIFRKQIRSKFIRSFLDYTPYAVLGALTFPDVFTSTGHLYSAVGGTIVAVILGYKGKSLVVVAIAAIVTVYLLAVSYTHLTLPTTERV